MKRFAVIFLGVGLAVVAAAQSQTKSGVAFRQEGIAGWYGDEFEGQPTASGETFDPCQMTAAHPTLPFGTFLNVTNRNNNKRVTVRVNDRGPFVAARVIDLSKAAAQYLDMITTGTAPVIIEVADGAAGTSTTTGAPKGSSAGATPTVSTELQHVADNLGTVATNLGTVADDLGTVATNLDTIPATGASSGSQGAAKPASSQPRYQRAVIMPGIPPAGTGKLYRIQVGAFKLTRNAVDAFDRLKAVGLAPAYERYGEMYRVVIAHVRPEDVPVVAERLGAAGFREALIREER